MAQIIRHRKGVLESVVSATKRKAELLIVTGSSGITSTNSDAMIFFGDGTDATPSNKMLYGTATPNLTGASYSTAVDGIPYYNTTEGKLYILAKGGNIEISSNTDGTGIYSGSAQVLADFLSDNANVNVGSGDFTTTGSGSFGDINVSGNATIDGNIILGGNINIGDANTDTVSFGGEISSNFIPSATNTYNLGSATDKFAEVHATTLFGAINATNGIVSGSSQVVGILDELNSYTASNDTDQSAQDARLSALEVETGSIDSAQTAQDARLSALETETGSIDTAQNAQDGRLSNIESFTSSIDTTIKTKLDADNVISSSAQLLNVATDFGTGRVSGDNFGDADGGSTFTGSFNGDGSGLTGLVSDLRISGSTGNDIVSLLNDDLSVIGTANEITTAVTNNQIQISLPDDVTIGNNLTVVGNLEVQGTTTTVDSTTVQIGDNIIELNGSGAANGGLLVKDATAPNTVSGSLLWDSTNDYWKGGALGSEIKFLRENGDDVVSGSAQVVDMLDELNAYTASNDTNQTAQDARLSALETETGSIDSAQTAQDARLSSLETETGSIDTAQGVQDGRLDNIETFTASLDTTFEEIASGTHTLVSGSSQVTSGAASGEVLYKNASDNTIDGSAIYSDGTDLISIGTATGNVGDLASGNQLSLYGSSISGLLSFDISGTSKSFDYVASDFRYVDTNAGVGIVLKPNADANKAWIIDTDGDLVSNSNNASVTGSIYAANVVARGDISGSNLLLTGNANIDGDITLGGNITIGDGSADSLTINADIESDIRPNADNTYDLGATTLRYAEIHGTNIYGAINATNGVISGSAQLLNVATDFGSGRVSGDNFGDLDGGSTITGSFVGDGSGITGLSTTISVSGSDGSNDTVSLLDGAITFDGGTGVSTAVATDTVTISVQDASTSAKGIASFSSDDFSVSSGDVTLKAGNGVDSSGGVRGANLNADTAGDGLSYSLSNQQLDVDYGSTANTAVEGNTTATFTGTANEITVSDSSAQALGGGIAVTISLPDDVTIGNDLTVTTDASVGGNLSVTGNLSVLGTTTTIDSTTVNIGDNILELNYGGAQTTSGLQVTDSTGGNTVSGSLVWDGTNDYWKAGALGSEKEIALLNAAPTTNTVLKADSNGLLVDSVLTDDGTDATFSGDVIVSGLSVGSNGGFLYVDTSNQLNSATATNAGDVIQWDGSSFVASNELDGGTF
jgi:X-X-X-Leu-X-X-Gly heptad repeat protein